VHGDTGRGSGRAVVVILNPRGERRWW